MTFCYKSKYLKWGRQIKNQNKILDLALKLLRIKNILKIVTEQVFFADGHFHCVSPLGANVSTSTVPKENLEEVCSRQTWSFDLALSGQNCTAENPQICPLSTLCCNDQCYGKEVENFALPLPDFKCRGSL